MRDRQAKAARRPTDYSSTKQSIGDSDRSSRGPKLNCVGAETHPYQRLGWGLSVMSYSLISAISAAHRSWACCGTLFKFSARERRQRGWLACLLREFFVKHGKAVYSRPTSKSTVQTLSREPTAVHATVRVLIGSIKKQRCHSCLHLST